VKRTFFYSGKKNQKKKRGHVLGDRSRGKEEQKDFGRSGIQGESGKKPESEVG